MDNDFYKIYGAEGSHDGIIKLSDRHCVIIYGYGTDDLGGWNWRKDYDHVPSISEVRNDIEALVNAQTDEIILNGLVWNGKPVYLSSENQFNFKAANDLCIHTGGANLPMKLKLGEDVNGNAVYHTFTKAEVLDGFVTSIFGHILSAIRDGWAEKYSVDYSLYEIQEP